ncbi:MAG: cupin domain-containing protein [bacterium]|nr:cupin domain-containing protein [bacterium]
MEHVNEKEKEFRNKESGPKYLFRGPRLEWGILVLKPGEKLGHHFHNEVEETFFLLEGEADMIINDRKIEAVQGDAYRLEPRDRHDILNRSGQPVKFIFIKTPYIPEDKVSC